MAYIADNKIKVVANAAEGGVFPTAAATITTAANMQQVKIDTNKKVCDKGVFFI